MFSLAQHKYLPTLHHQASTKRPPLHPAVRVSCSINSEPKPPNAKQLVIKPRLAPPPPAAASTTPLTRPADNDPSLISDWSHRAWTTAGCTTVLYTLAQSISGANDTQTQLELVFAAFAGYIVADLVTGIYHWGLDNYGDGSTPVFGPAIDNFQEHHRWPWVITKRQFARNLHALARTVTLIALPVDLLFHDPVLQGFMGWCLGCVMFSRQFHSWAHYPKSRLPKAVVALQDAGVLVGRSMHAEHHRPPYITNYCIVSGVWNPVLDKIKFFEAMEKFLYRIIGVRPRCWDDPAANGWMEENDEEVSQIKA